MDKTLLTKSNIKKLEEELEYLKCVKRKEITEMIKEAKSFGDLSENSEYDAAKDEQAKYEARIKQIEFTLSNYELVNEEDIDDNYIRIGSFVKILFLEEKEEDVFQLTTKLESDFELNKISNTSPIGQALMNRMVNETVKAITPNGILNIKILEISKTKI